jgi:hypothetical protein
LREAGVALRPPGQWGRGSAKPAIGVTTDFGAELATASASREAQPDAEVTIDAVPVSADTDGDAAPPSAMPAVEVPPTLAELRRHKRRRRSRRPAPARCTGTPSNGGLPAAAMPWRSGRTWSIPAASPAATRASSGRAQVGRRLIQGSMRGSRDRTRKRLW